MIKYFTIEDLLKHYLQKKFHILEYNMKVLVDTCIIIDALQSRVPFAEVAQKIFIHSANKHFEGYLETEIIRGRKRN